MVGPPYEGAATRSTDGSPARSFTGRRTAFTEADSGCDGPAARKLLSVEQALATALELVSPVVETELRALESVTGRALARPVHAAMPLPPFDHAAMDGYAVRVDAMTGSGPWRLRICRRSAAGDAPPGLLSRCDAVPVFTGAAIPPNCDAVIIQEHVTRLVDDIVVAARPSIGLNIRRKGEDVPAGAVLVDAATELGPRQCAAIAATGCSRVVVRRRLRVGLLRTGNELRTPGSALGAGQIHDANRFGLGASLCAPWTEPVRTAAARDDPAALSAALQSLAEGCDLVVSTGGASVGEEDHMVRAAAMAGGHATQLGVAMKPGKPLLLGHIGSAAYLGLPGNPVAALVSWALFGEPMARCAAGFALRARLAATVTLASPIRRRPGRREFRPARLVGPDTAEPLDQKFAARIGGFASCDGLIVLPESVAELDAGARIAFHAF